MDITGKTISSVNEQRMFGRNQWDDELRWTVTTLTFTDGTSTTFAADDSDNYTSLTLDGTCRFCESALSNDNGTWVDKTGSDNCLGDIRGTNANEPHVPTFEEI